MLPNCTKHHNETVNTQRNPLILAKEISKVKNDLPPGIIKDIFIFVEKSYNLRNNKTLKKRCNHSVILGIENISSLALKTWELISDKIKTATSLELFKKQHCTKNEVFH